MTKEVFYKKEGRKYVPVSEYDFEFSNSFPKGTHLILHMEPGATSYYYNIDPALAPMTAAAKYGINELSTAIMEETHIRNATKTITEEQAQAWNDFIKVMGNASYMLEYPSARECAEKAMKKLEIETEKMLKVPAVRKAYEQFLLVYKLTKDEMNEPSR